VQRARRVRRLRAARQAARRQALPGRAQQAGVQPVLAPVPAARRRLQPARALARRRAARIKPVRAARVGVGREGVARPLLPRLRRARAASAGARRAAGARARGAAQVARQQVRVAAAQHGAEVFQLVDALAGGLQRLGRRARLDRRVALLWQRACTWAGRVTISCMHKHTPCFRAIRRVPLAHSNRFLAPPYH